MLTICAAIGIMIGGCSASEPLPHPVTLAQWDALMEFEPQDRRQFAMIAWCESRWQTGAVGDHGQARGVWQVHGRFHGTVPATLIGQAKQAARIFARWGAQPWTTRNGCPSW